MSDNQLLDRLVGALESLTKDRMHTKAPGNFNSAQLLTQPSGLFTVTGLERELFSTHIRPMGLGAVLPAMPSNVDDPRYGFITGFSDDIGSEPTTPCDDAPTGYMKGGTLTAQFGRVQRGTDTIEIDATLHQQRGASTDLRVLGEMLNTGDGMVLGTGRDPMQTVIDAQMVGAGVRMERKLATMLWQGSPANNTAGGGYKEFPGLDNQIATGQIDADTGTALPSTDSLIYNFNYNAVDGTGFDIVEYLSMMEFYLRDIARRTGLLPVTWAVVMRPELWFELSSVWPCRYLTNRCTEANGTSPMVINDNVNVQLRDAMRNGSYIDINGNRYPVITDDGIFEHTNVNNGNVAAGHYASSIYMVPMRVIGNFPVTYWEYINYNNINAQLAALGPGARNAPFWVHPGGRFLWVYKPNGLCFNLQVKAEPRVVLRTPHLAGKVQNVTYSPMSHLRDSQPSSAYWVNGGVSLRSVTTGQAVWA